MAGNKAMTATPGNVICSNILSRQTSNKHLNFGFAHIFTVISDLGMAGMVCIIAKQNAHTSKSMINESLIAAAVLQPSSSTDVLQGKVSVCVRDIAFKHE